MRRRAVLLRGCGMSHTAQPQITRPGSEPPFGGLGTVTAPALRCADYQSRCSLCSKTVVLPPRISRSLHIVLACSLVCLHACVLNCLLSVLACCLLDCLFVHLFAKPLALPACSILCKVLLAWPITLGQAKAGGGPWGFTWSTCRAPAGPAGHNQ